MVGAASARALSAPCGEDPVELGRVGAKLDQPVRSGAIMRHQRVGQRRLERAEALAGEWAQAPTSTVPPVTAA